ncbi:MAG: hypothetical protein WBG43_13085 [Marinifilaceae bacterium]
MADYKHTDLELTTALVENKKTRILEEVKAFAVIDARSGKTLKVTTKGSIAVATREYHEQQMNEAIESWAKLDK